MKWDRDNKKVLQRLIKAKLTEICDFGLSMDEACQMRKTNPSLPLSSTSFRVTLDYFMAIDSQRRDRWIALRQQFFDDFGILLGLPKAAKAKKYLTLDVFMPTCHKRLLAVKATKISIPKDVAEKFLLLGIP